MLEVDPRVRRRKLVESAEPRLNRRRPDMAETMLAELG
jgi:hypothetical protein